MKFEPGSKLKFSVNFCLLGGQSFVLYILEGHLLFEWGRHPGSELEATGIFRYSSLKLVDMTVETYFLSGFTFTFCSWKVKQSSWEKKYSFISLAVFSPECVQIEHSNLYMFIACLIMTAWIFWFWSWLCCWVDGDVFGEQRASNQWSLGGHLGSQSQESPVYSSLYVDGSFLCRRVCC